MDLGLEGAGGRHVLPDRGHGHLDHVEKPRGHRGTVALPRGGTVDHANGIWMVGEFWFADTKRHVAIPFFIAGLVCVGWYYLVVLPRQVRKAKS